MRGGQAVNMTNLALKDEARPAPAPTRVAYTYRDYRDWELEPGERYELIEGVVHAMAAPGDRHQAILIALASRLYQFLEDSPCKVRPAPYDVRLFYEEDGSDDTVVQSDISVICDAAKRGEEGCRGAPDLVVEIRSPSNTAVEMDRKRELYRRAGVREYWVVDMESEVVTAYDFAGGDCRPRVFDGRSTALPGLVVDLKRVFA